MSTTYTKALRALEVAEDYMGRALSKLPGPVPSDVEREVRTALTWVRRARDKVAAEEAIERSQT